MDYLFLAGRVLFGGFFASAGFMHFKGLEMLTGYAQSKKVPMANVAVIGTGLMLFAGGLGIILGAYTNISLWLIIIFLAVSTPMMHAFWTVTDPMAKMGETVNFKKNLALLGGALMLLSLATPWVMLVL